MEVGGQPLVLLPEKAAFLPASRTLLVADLHIGKAVSFRGLGLPVPRGTTTETLATLAVLVDRLGARRVALLGDFLHSRHAHAPATLTTIERWRRQHAALELLLVRGNHDDRAGDPPYRLGIEPIDEPLRLDGLALCHHPRPDAGAYVIAGHLHPCITLAGRGHDRLRLPCFWFRTRVGVLPAFGAFTGMQPIRPGPADRLFAIADQHVAEICHPARRDMHGLEQLHGGVRRTL